MPTRHFTMDALPAACLAASAAVCLVLATCAQRPNPSSPVPTTGVQEPDPCLIRPDSIVPPAAAVDTVRIGLVEPVVMTHAPVPTNRAERLVFAELYEPLAYRDCRGTLRPRMAASWASEDSGTTWSLVLRDDLRFWGAPAPVTTRDLIDGWTQRWGASVPEGGEIRSLEPVDDRTLRLTLSSPAAEPSMLTDPRSAGTAMQIVPGASWPMGTGPFRIEEPAADRLVLAPVRAGMPVLDFWIQTGGDPRDLLDRGADLLVTSDPRLLDYAASRGDRVSVPLPWDRTFVFLTLLPVESLPPPLTLEAGSREAASFRESLARDAVRAESRAAQPPFWLERLGCDRMIGSHLPSPHPRLRAHSARLGYLRGDPTARDLAERIVAVAGRARRWISTGYGSEELDGAMRSDSVVGFVTPAAQGDLSTCPLPFALPTRIYPLVETRERAILRKGSPSWTVEPDGTLLLVGR